MPPSSPPSGPDADSEDDAFQDPWRRGVAARGRRPRQAIRGRAACLGWDFCPTLAGRAFALHVGALLLSCSSRQGAGWVVLRILSFDLSPDLTLDLVHTDPPEVRSLRVATEHHGDRRATAAVGYFSVTLRGWCGSHEGFERKSPL